MAAWSVDSNRVYMRDELDAIGILTEEDEFLVVSVIDEMREYWMLQEGDGWKLDHTWRQIWLKDG